MSLALALALCLGLCACGGNADGDASTAPSTSGSTGRLIGGAVETPPASEENSTLKLDSIAVTGAQNFSEGMALIKFKDQIRGLNYMGMIDKAGALHAYSAAAREVEYVDGYVYMASEKMLYVLDQELKPLSSFPENIVKGYGGGYTVTVEQNTGFDASGYTARILTAAGQEVTSKVFSDKVQVEYLGQGVFAFWANNRLNVLGVCCAASQTWVEECSFNVIVCGNWFLCNFEEGGTFSCFDATGTFKSTVLPVEYPAFENVRQLAGVNDTALFALYFQDNIELIAFNANSETFVKYQGAYQDRLSTYTLVGGCDRLAAAMVGMDGQLYTLLLDENLEDQSGPIPGEPIAIADGYLYTKGDSGRIVYDLQGNEVSRPQSIPDTSTAVRDGAYYGVYNTVYSFYSADGTPLFENVDYSTGHLVELP